MIQVDLTDDLERVMDRKIKELKDDLIYEIAQIGKPEYIDRETAAGHLGYSTRDSVTRWLEQHPGVHYFNNGNKIMINRKELLDSIRNQ